MQRIRSIQLAGIIAAVAVGISACDQTAPTTPTQASDIISRVDGGPASALGNTPYPGTKIRGKVVLCKDASSLPGTYNFSVSASPTVAGDLVSSSVALAPGTCSIVFERPTVGGLFVDVLISENLPNGAIFKVDHVTSNDDINGTQNKPEPRTTVSLNGWHSAVATFFNVAKPSNGHVILCKSSNSPEGTFNFTVSAIGTIPLDQVTTAVALTANQCATVFTRTETSLVAATLTITESLVGNPGLSLSKVTVNGSIAATVGGGLDVQQNRGPDKVVVFFNARLIH